MAVVAGVDETGPWAAVGCDTPGCMRHVSARPPTAEGCAGWHDLLSVVFDWAYDEGWRLEGEAWCPEHARGALERARTPDLLAPWVNVRQAAR